MTRTEGGGVEGAGAFSVGVLKSSGISFDAIFIPVILPFNLLIFY
jgi:hypothetical protein